MDFRRLTIAICATINVVAQVHVLAIRACETMKTIADSVFAGTAVVTGNVFAVVFAGLQKKQQEQ